LLYRGGALDAALMIVDGPGSPGIGRKLDMARRTLAAVLGAFLVASSAGAWAASEDEKRIINGPSKTSFGGLQLVLGQGASAETNFQPDASKLTVKTLVGEARIVTSARNLILVENTAGRTEILLPNGRLIVVEPGKAEIVGRALVDDPGNITIRLSGTGPIAQAGGPTVPFTQSTTDITVLTSVNPNIIDPQDTNENSNRVCTSGCS
jgi:hypothetical protein